MVTLENVLQIVTATSDQSFDDLVELMKPNDHSREEMQELYDETLGYDPTEFFDKRDMEEIADYIAEDPNTPSEAVEYIREQKKDLVDAAFEQFDECRSTFLQSSIEQIIEQETGVELDTDPIDEDDSEDLDYEDDEDQDDDFDEGNEDEDYD